MRMLEIDVWGPAPPRDMILKKGRRKVAVTNI